jgi:hypothetical protein
MTNSLLSLIEGCGDPFAFRYVEERKRSELFHTSGKAGMIGYERNPIIDGLIALPYLSNRRCERRALPFARFSSITSGVGIGYLPGGK